MNAETKKISLIMSFPEKVIYEYFEEEKAIQAKIIAHKAIEEIWFQLLISAIDNQNKF